MYTGGAFSSFTVLFLWCTFYCSQQNHNLKQRWCSFSSFFYSSAGVYNLKLIPKLPAYKTKSKKDIAIPIFIFSASMGSIIASVESPWFWSGWLEFNSIDVQRNARQFKKEQNASRPFCMRSALPVQNSLFINLAARIARKTKIAHTEERIPMTTIKIVLPKLSNEYTGIQISLPGPFVVAVHLESLPSTVTTAKNIQRENTCVEGQAEGRGS